MQTGSETGFRFRRNPFHSFCRLHANRFGHRFHILLGPTRFARLDRSKRSTCKPRNVRSKRAKTCSMFQVQTHLAPFWAF